MMAKFKRKIKEIAEQAKLMYEGCKAMAQSLVSPMMGTYSGNIAGFIVATVTAVIIGAIILMYMISTAKDIAGNDTEMVDFIDKIGNLGEISLFFGALAGFVIAAKFIIDIVNSGKNQGGM
jgi:hypothetical protein